MQAVIGGHPGAFRLGITFLSLHAPHQFGDHSRAQLLVDNDLVFLFHALARMHEPVGDIPAIGQQKEALALLIQTAHMVQGLVFGGKQGINGGPLVGVPARADIAPGFVKS